VKDPLRRNKLGKSPEKENAKTFEFFAFFAVRKHEGRQGMPKPRKLSALMFSKTSRNRTGKARPHARPESYKGASRHPGATCLPAVFGFG